MISCGRGTAKVTFVMSTSLALATEEASVILRARKLQDIYLQLFTRFWSVNMTNMTQENPCEVCQTTTKSEVESEEHQLLKHLKCPKCQVEHNSLAALLCHQTFEHRDGNWLKECLHCDFISTPRLVRVHELDKHSDKDEFDNDEEVLMETENEEKVVEPSSSDIDSTISSILREVIAKVVGASHENEPDEEPMTVEDDEKPAKIDLNSAVECIIDEMIAKVVVDAANGNKLDEDEEKIAKADLNTAVKIIIDEVISKVVAVPNEPNGEDDAQPAVGDAEKSPLDTVIEDVTPTELDTAVNPFENLKSAPEDYSALQIGTSDETETPKETTAQLEPQPVDEEQEVEPKDSKATKSDIDFTVEIILNDLISRVIVAKHLKPMHDKNEEMDIFEPEAIEEQSEPKESKGLNDNSKAHEEPTAKLGLDFAINVINEIISNVVAKHSESIENHHEPEPIPSAKISLEKMENDDVDKTSLPRCETSPSNLIAKKSLPLPRYFFSEIF